MTTGAKIHFSGFLRFTHVTFTTANLKTFIKEQNYDLFAEKLFIESASKLRAFL